MSSHSANSKPASIPATPPLPKHLPKIELTDNARQVLERRYVRRAPDGKPAETIEEMFWRVAYHIALAEQEFGGDPIPLAEQYYDLLITKRFFPNSPTFTGAGTPLGQLAACFVLPIGDDMGRKSNGIFQTLRDAALIQQTGGGNGFSFSRLRPKGSLVKSSAGQATGPVGFLRVYDHAFGEVAQGGTRRGANMAVLRVDHPDLEEFITCKTDENQITNFNISVGITDAFMRAVESDGGWDLKFPDVTDPHYKEFEGTLDQAREQHMPLKVYRRVRARELFEKIVRQGHHNGEPGVLFIDAANRSNPVPHLYQLEATNPCGEQWLGPYENCCLGSINLAQHLGADNQVDWEKLRQSTELSTRYLDNVVDANKYVPAVPQLKESALRARRIGLGIMGLADLMYHVGVRYGSTEGQEFAAQVMEFVRYHSM
ncbi:MAG TPA: adenosylcobalamin-dependent ribonucleoside-diphosphate reductase, partial [Longilinea sp.]|nr:adenosylcobalamin-dependent ribonucleoside-diphosphate reductase [Longilinea sp.]